jgi:hypothetical protein
MIDSLETLLLGSNLTTGKLIIKQACPNLRHPNCTAQH